VPKHLTQYRIFIGSPGGLDEERNCFKDRLGTYTALNAEHVDGELFWGREHLPDIREMLGRQPLDK